MGLREVLADLDVKVRGLGQVRAANVELDQYVADLGPARGALDALKVKQAEAAEMASRLAARIRDLQKAEGNHAQEILETRVAMFRAQEAATGYGRQIEDLVNPAVDASIPLAVSWADALQGLRVIFDAVSAGARFFADQVREVVDAGAELDDTATRLNLSASALQEWGFVFEQQGASVETLTRGLEGLTRSAAAGSAAYARLGVHTRDSSGHLRSQEDLLRDSLRALAGVTNSTERAALAQRVFGRAGTEMLGVVRGGPEEIDRLTERFHELGGGMSEASVAAAAAADDAFGELRTSLVSLRDVLAPVVLPVIAETVRTIASGVGRVVELGRETTLVSNAWRLGAAVLRGFVPQLRALWAVVRFMAAPWIGLGLAIDDVMTGLAGGRSIIASWVEGWSAAEGRIVTFQGFLASLRVDLLETNAEILTLGSVMADAFGLADTDLAAGLRARSEAAIADFRGARDALARDESERFRARDLGARSAIIAGGGAKGDAALSAARAAAAASITRNTSITINGGDPREVERVVRRVVEEDRRAEVDGLALAAPEAA